MRKKTQVRESVIAGWWYPGQPDALRGTIDDFMNRVESQPIAGELIALIAPHAGYAFSGQTAAYAYQQVAGRSYDVVAIVSPMHRMLMGRLAVTSAAAYKTPLGSVKLDEELIEALAKEVRLERVDRDEEHSLEIQLPFLQVTLGDFGLLPIMIGTSSFEAGEELGMALAGVLGGRQSLMVASTDLHHIENYDEVVRRDEAVVDAIASFDMTRVKEVLSPWDCSVCGRIPVYAVLTAAGALGANKVAILHHTNSGDVTGNRMPGQYTVGYLAAAIYREEE
jgi:AmmeMemoRadiSam system protein B